MARIVCLGEIMLRLSVETGIRLNHTQQLEAYYGGGEANVAVSLANYGHQVNSPVRLLKMDLVKQLSVI